MKKLKSVKYFKTATVDHSSVMTELDTLDYCQYPESAEPRIEAMEDSEIVDFVLVYDANDRKSPQRGTFSYENRERIRAVFENNLLKTGLILEKEVVDDLTFVKIYAPKSVLKTYCEIMKLKMPLKEEKKEQLFPEEFNVMNSVKTACRKFIRYIVTIDPSKTYHESTTLYAEYCQDKFYLFDEDGFTFFTPSIRILVIDFILNRTQWTEDEEDRQSVGIQTLIDKDVYKAAYPVHDGGYYEEGCLRNLLRQDWAPLRKWIRLQPIDDVKNYLGVKFGFYFAWLGFYTQLLIPASIMGLAVFFHGLYTLPQDPISSFACNNGSNFTMCPLCDKKCRYWELSDTCVGAKITYLFDNNLSVVFAFLLSIWATLFLELWKRHAAILSHRWGLSDYNSQWEHPCPEFLAKLSDAKKKKFNVETGQVEPVVSFWFYKLPTVIFSYTVVIFFILVAVAAVSSIVVYRMWMNNVYTWVDNSHWLSKYSSTIVPIVAGLLNLASIMVLNQIYDKIAYYLTNLELPRTQTEFDNSLTIKMYIFQFVNYYASIMYVAFLKGKFVGYPSKYNKIWGYRQEECTGGACLTELSIQLAIIMGGQQFYGTIVEMIVPAGWSWFNRYSLTKKRSMNNIPVGKRERWVEDYKLLEWSKQGLFSEYLEIAIQFGFVTLFASAFPLAPVLALVNNVFELRLDAQKILKYYRRPVPYQIPNIGVWYRIFDIIGKLAVIFNAAIIAFSSNFIPLLVYHLERDRPSSFIEFSTSVFNTSLYANTSTEPAVTSLNVTQCRYYGYRDNHNNKHTKIYWKVLTYRLIFMFLFQNAVFTIKTAAQWLIPDVPQKLNERIRREARLVTDLRIKREKEALSNAAVVDENDYYSNERKQCETFLHNNIVNA